MKDKCILTITDDDRSLCSLLLDQDPYEVIINPYEIKDLLNQQEEN